jgi:hypothetical protein
MDSPSVHLNLVPTAPPRPFPILLEEQSDGDEQLVLVHGSPQAATKQAFPGPVPPSSWIVFLLAKNTLNNSYATPK